MKRKILMALVFIICIAEAKACDICGCGAGNSYIGILPDFHKQIFGIRYRYNFLKTHVGVGGITTYLTTKESYRTAEVWTGWNIGSRYRIMASVPYNFDEQQTLTKDASKNGIGDISVSGYYQLMNKRNRVGADSSKLMVQSLWVGAGIKLPTGKYQPADKSAAGQNANLFQLGTASTDFSFNAMYDLRLNDAGINIASSYKINTENKYKYQYGNKFSINSQLYYKFRINKKVLIAPNAGISYESSQKDFDTGFRGDLTGGRLTMGTLGAEIAFSKMAIGFNIQTALAQNLGAGFIKAEQRGMAHVSFAF